MSHCYDSGYAAPINVLPVELLSYIFVLSTHYASRVPDEGSIGNLGFNEQSVTTPVILSTVNRHWRQVALATPVLWTSLCVTIQDIDTSAADDDEPMCFPSKGNFAAIDTTHLTSYLALSRNHSLDILIDARDHEWDFTEDGIPSAPDEYVTYTHPFTSAHMYAVLSLLLPHLPRWRSLDILTDTWAPMYTALRQLSLALAAPAGAPRLESLTLMRCNDFVSLYPDFEPRALAEPVMLNFGVLVPASNSAATCTPSLPRLRHLTLRGVHVHWASLPYLLPTACPDQDDKNDTAPGLRTLELSYHSPSVRPTLSEFQSLLRACPHLKQLVLNGSGPALPYQNTHTVPSNASHPTGSPLHHPYPPHSNTSAVSLPRLTALTLAYRSVREGSTALQALTAPNLHALALEDAQHPPYDDTGTDSDTLLRYLGGGRDADPYSTNRDADAPKDTDNGNSGAPFPRLKHVTLTRVRGALGAFLHGAGQLERLELVGMALGGASALLPAPVDGEVPLVCPRLRTVCIRGLGAGGINELRELVGRRGVEVEVEVEDVGGNVDMDCESDEGDMRWV